MNAFDLAKWADDRAVIREVINTTVIHDVAQVVEVIDENTIKASAVGALLGATRLYVCPVLQIRTKDFSIFNELSVGDRVLIISIPYKFEGMLEDKEQYFESIAGYTPYTCFAIPIGSFNPDAKKVLKVLKDAIDFVVDSDVTVSIEKDLSVDANSVTINGGDKGAARKGDTVKLSLSALDIQTLAVSLLATGGFTPASAPVPGTPVTFTGGEITSGSDTVKVG